MSTPGASNKTVGDLVQDVTDYLQQRTDAAPLAPRYIRRALQEITDSNPFEELRVTGPLTQLTSGQSIYPVRQFLNSGDDYTSPESFTAYIDFPTNQVTQPIDYKTPKAIEQMISPVTTGPPSRFTRYGTNFFIGPTPNLPYTVFLRYQRKHPFPDDVSQLATAPIFIPSAWEDVVALSAAERIAFVKRWNDQYKEIHNMLYGDPEFMTSQGKRGRPGLMSALQFQVERDQMFNTRQFTPVVARYNAR